MNLTPVTLCTVPPPNLFLHDHQDAADQLRSFSAPHQHTVPLSPRQIARMQFDPAPELVQRDKRDGLVLDAGKKLSPVRTAITNEDAQQADHPFFDEPQSRVAESICFSGTLAAQATTAWYRFRSTLTRGLRQALLLGSQRWWCMCMAKVSSSPSLSSLSGPGAGLDVSCLCKRGNDVFWVSLRHYRKGRGGCVGRYGRGASSTPRA